MQNSINPQIPHNAPNGFPFPAMPEPFAVDPESLAVVEPRAEGTNALLRCGRGLLRTLSSFLSSLVAHAAVLLLLALVTCISATHQRRPTVILSNAGQREADLAIVEFEVVADLELPTEFSSSMRIDHVPHAPEISRPFSNQIIESTSPPKLALYGPAAANDLLLRTTRPTGGGIQGRDAKMRAQLVAERGGSMESEEAVGRGLAWLAAHQRNDGSWRLNFHKGPCEGRCRDPGKIGTTTGATALALLPFLGAGHTSEQGDYQETVDRGLYYLMGRMLRTRHGGDLQEGTMYAQGIATIALCEAYAMTEDEKLRPVAQSAIDFICNAQHPKGGWRYVPGQPGDTTVFGWQLMALKSGRMAGLFVPSPVIELAKQYLDGAQSGDGAFYGYIRPGKAPGPTSSGLLSRMYLGWQQDDERLARGARHLATIGPSKSDMYFNYYATQVLHHQEGPHWEAWNYRLREYLLESQATAGHEVGSWHFEDQHGTAAGRLYNTAMCLMILEVYYRHMPLYGERAVDEDL